MDNTKTKRAPLKIAYMTFTVGYVVADAKAEFEKKYGNPPAEWFFDCNLLKVGPIPDNRKAQA